MLCNSTWASPCRRASSSTAWRDRLDGEPTTTSSGTKRRSPAGGAPLRRGAAGVPARLVPSPIAPVTPRTLDSVFVTVFVSVFVTVVVSVLVTPMVELTTVPTASVAGRAG